MSITLNTKVYSGRGIVAGISSWAEYGTSGLLAAWSWLTGQVSLPQGENAKAHIKWKLALPTVAEESSACACTGEQTGLIDAILTVRADRSVPEAVRTDFALRLKDLVASTEVQASIISFTQPDAS